MATIGCAYCGFRYADDLPACPSCRRPTLAPPDWLFVNPPHSAQPPAAPLSAPPAALDQTMPWRPDYAASAGFTRPAAAPASPPAWPADPVKSAAAIPPRRATDLGSVESGTVPPPVPAWSAGSASGPAPTPAWSAGPIPAPPPVPAWAANPVPVSPPVQAGRSARRTDPAKSGPAIRPRRAVGVDEAGDQADVLGGPPPARSLPGAGSDAPPRRLTTPPAPATDWAPTAPSVTDWAAPAPTAPPATDWAPTAPPVTDWAPLPSVAPPETMFVPTPSTGQLTPEAILRPEPPDGVIVDQEASAARRTQSVDIRSLQWVLILGAVLVAAVLVAGALMVWG